MAPTVRQPQEKCKFGLCGTIPFEHFDNSPLEPSDDDPITAVLETHRPLPTTYLLALSQKPATQPFLRHDKPVEEPTPNIHCYKQWLSGNSCTQMGIADSVMAPVTAVDGPMLVVLISIIFSVILAVEVCEYLERRQYGRIHLASDLDLDLQPDQTPEKQPLILDSE
ncbi:hypothetical protein SUNI508_10791 [Seiridium unicorne]|uniref:Uncharacterized protein n=1 Tax=Seiridium unicorne TaxID=138068 RepID=A0ABR2UJP8_9PEZI